jgi:hypothetical protein
MRTLIIFCILILIPVLGFAQTGDSSKPISDTSCLCHASLPLEIATSSLIWGVPAYWGYRGAVDDTTISSLKAWPFVVLVSAFLPLISLAPVASWTSGCEENCLNSVWIGFGSSILCTALYAAVYGHDHVLDINKFNWPEYAALGVAPTVITSLWYNIFLHPRPKDNDGHNSDRGMYLLPSVSGDKSLALNFGMRF